jgi:hypothetical protein
LGIEVGREIDKLRGVVFRKCAFEKAGVFGQDELVGGKGIVTNVDDDVNELVVLAELPEFGFDARLAKTFAALTHDDQTRVKKLNPASNSAIASDRI